jgi:hypothetical protein
MTIEVRSALLFEGISRHGKVGSHLITVHAGADPDGLYCAPRSTAGDGVGTSGGIFNPETPMPLFEMYSRNVTFARECVSADTRAAQPDRVRTLEAGTDHDTHRQMDRGAGSGVLSRSPS